ncbi:MAG: metallopeptidase family protein [Chloroflexaceae bacterium]|nr:metallopeptidase family protein [Chloroflexaceae bacterium]
MDAPTFEQLVVEALDSLPPTFARYLENLEVVIERRPTREQRRYLGLKPWQTAYGCYDGVPLTERSSQGIVMPDTIIIFQEPLERDFRTLARLREEVRRTVLHEIAHAFGISDERLRELDAY